MNWAAFAWFVLMMVFIFVEAGTVAIVSTWFSVGALIAMIVSLLGGPLWLQTAVFFVVAVVLLLLFRPIVKKYFIPRLTRTNIDSIIGSAGMVTQTIQNDLSAGQVKLGAMEWTARSTDGSEIPEGTKVTVDRLEGVKVFVSKVEL